MEIGNEGKAALGVVMEMAEEALKALRTTLEGRDAAIVGEVRNDLEGSCLRLLLGGGG
ncbi:MAG: hypothetical protein KAU14_10390 [Thermoplasmata archaeon]|nr:hypothetical protein [Thermoplasmata archaeon]